MTQINQRLCNNWHCKDLTQKNSKSVTLILRSCTGIGMVLHKILDKALSSHHNWIKSIVGFAKKNEIVKHLSQNFYIKILGLWPSGLGYCKDLNTNFNTKILSKKISNDQEQIQSDPTFCPQNQKINN